MPPRLIYDMMDVGEDQKTFQEFITQAVVPCHKDYLYHLLKKILHLQLHQDMLRTDIFNITFLGMGVVHFCDKTPVMRALMYKPDDDGPLALVPCILTSCQRQMCSAQPDLVQPCLMMLLDIIASVNSSFATTRSLLWISTSLRSLLTYSPPEAQKFVADELLSGAGDFNFIAVLSRYLITCLRSYSSSTRTAGTDKFGEH